MKCLGGLVNNFECYSLYGDKNLEKDEELIKLILYNIELLPIGTEQEIWGICFIITKNIKYPNKFKENFIKLWKLPLKQFLSIYD